MRTNNLPAKNIVLKHLKNRIYGKFSLPKDYYMLMINEGWKAIPDGELRWILQPKKIHDEFQYKSGLMGPPDAGLYHVKYIQVDTGVHQHEYVKDKYGNAYTFDNMGDFDFKLDDCYIIETQGLIIKRIHYNTTTQTRMDQRCF